MNSQSTRLDATARPASRSRKSRRSQLIEVTIDSLAELGYVGTTLAQIAGRAGVSPGLVAHYFGDKDGLLEAAFRSLARRVGDQVRARLRQISTPRGRIQAIIDANLAPEEFDQRTGSAWLAFWGQVLQVKSLKRVQSVYQRRTLSNLQAVRCSKLVPPDEARKPGGHDRRDDRRRVAARGAVRLARGGQRERAGAADGIRRGRLQAARHRARAGGRGGERRREPSAAARPGGERFAIHQSGNGRGARAT